MHTWFTSSPNYNRKWTELSLFRIIFYADVLSSIPWWNISMKFIRITFFVHSRQCLSTMLFTKCQPSCLCINALTYHVVQLLKQRVGLSLVTSISAAAVCMSLYRNLSLQFYSITLGVVLYTAIPRRTHSSSCNQIIRVPNSSHIYSYMIQILNVRQTVCGVWRDCNTHQPPRNSPYKYHRYSLDGNS